MPAVSALLPQPNRRGRVAVYIDGAFAFTLAQELALQAGLSIGTALDEVQIRDLGSADARHQALQTAYRYLSYSARSEAEVRARLRRHGDTPETIDAVVVKLNEQRVLDDAQLATDYAGNRVRTAPRSRRMVTFELRRKGIAEDLVEAAVESLDDDITAYRAAVKRAERLKQMPYLEFRLKLSGFLQRRGFSYGVAARAVAKVWREVGSTDSDDEE